MLDGFTEHIVELNDVTLFARSAGSGAPLLLLHGFPETHLMWRDVAPILASRFTVVCADLRGYGRSSCPRSSPDHIPYSKRTTATDMVELMARLGFGRFMVAGHDRGGRVAYRMALDHPASIEKLAVLDILPTGAVWDRADSRLALAFWPWSLLAQPEPLPERLISGAPEAVIDNAVAQWGSQPGAFPPEVRQAYAHVLRDPEHVHAICEEYRAGAGIDRDHDKDDMAAGRKIGCPLLALWSGEGALASWYTDEGGPLALWRTWCDDVRGGPVRGGHFFPEEHPGETAAALLAFFSEANAAAPAR
jgi:haloacetate dehalogenase